ncbi:MAG: hypothetical protein K2Z81_04580 [Cyanobacteria bacterium]|nr:hypothetical protein [Cyanobacteriota bacterium]
MKKRLLVSAMLASVLGLGIFATSSFASGPVILGPTPAPAVPVTPAVQASPIKVKLVSAYRSVRAFWLSRAIVR